MDTEAFEREFGFDPWELGDDDEEPAPSEPHKGYDIAKFFTKSTNDHDHSATVRFRLQPHLYAAVNDIVHARRIPQYRSPQDFFRNWSYHGLMYECTERIPTPQMDAALRQEAQRAEFQRIRDEAALYDQDVENYRTTLESATRLRNQRLLRQVIASAEEHLDGLPEPWRGQLGDLIARYVDRG